MNTEAIVILLIIALYQVFLMGIACHKLHVEDTGFTFLVAFGSFIVAALALVGACSQGWGP